MDIFWTVLAGATVYVLGQAVMKFVVEPWYEYRMTIGKIAHAVIIYGQSHAHSELVSPVPVDEARRELMNLSGELMQRTYAIPSYGLFARIFPTIATWEQIRFASAHLGGLSKSLGPFDNTRYQHITQIRTALRLHDPDIPLPVRRSIRQRFVVRRRKSV